MHCRFHIRRDRIGYRHVETDEQINRDAEILKFLGGEQGIAAPRGMADENDSACQPIGGQLPANPAMTDATQIL